MQRDLIINVFAALQGLEKAIADSRKQATNVSNYDALEAVRSQETVVRKMRRTANRLQIDLAGNNWGSSIRLLKIFYGLNHMLRPEVIKTRSALYGNALSVERTAQTFAQSIIH